MDRASLTRARINGEWFCGTFSSETNAKQQASVFKLKVRPFGVRLKRIDPATREALEWEKERGFSTWL